jgi:Tfp pilus assembly protein PilN
MKAFNIDFAPPSLFRTLQSIHPLGWLMLALSLALLLAVALTSNRLLRQSQQIQQEVQRKQGLLLQRQPVKVAVVPVTIPEAQANAVNNAVAQLNLPWHTLLNTLEAGTPKTIALLSLEPDARKQTLKGVAEARDGDAMLDFISALKQQDFFDQVWLSKHETVEQDPNRPLRFQFEAHWEGEAP